MQDILNVVTQLINSVGFPIACVCVMFYTSEKDKVRHAEESKGFVEAINNNTLAVTKLVEKMDTEDKNA